MVNRWTILAVLFLVRTTMAFQFQATAAASPFLMEAYGVGLSEIGVMIGLYLAPGVIVAIPGGAMAAWLGEKRLVAMSMGVMLIGAGMAYLGPDWGWVTAGRLVAGAGGVVLNIVMTKMLVDWFVGREVSTAMAIFINSWPIGIALGLVALPWIGTWGGLEAVRWTVAGFILLGLGLFLAIYRAPPGQGPAEAPSLNWVGLPILPLVLAGLIWALYNAALAMVFSFGPAILEARGLAVTTAGSLTSVFIVVLAVCLPFGGILADKTGRRDPIIALSLVSFALLMPVALLVPPSVVLGVFVVTGGLFALAAGPIMTMPAAVLPPEARSFGMGIFFTIYYVVMMLAPPAAGVLAEQSGEPGTALYFGVAMCVICLGLLVGWRRVVRPKTTRSA